MTTELNDENLAPPMSGGAFWREVFLKALTAKRTAEEAAENARLRSALRGMLDSAEYWANRVDRSQMTESEWRTWHALSFGSNAWQAARAALQGATP